MKTTTIASEHIDGDNESCTLNALGNLDRGISISTYMQVGRIKSTMYVQCCTM